MRLNEYVAERLAVEMRFTEHYRLVALYAALSWPVICVFTWQVSDVGAPVSIGLGTLLTLLLVAVGDALVQRLELAALAHVDAHFEALEAHDLGLDTKVAPLVNRPGR